MTIPDKLKGNNMKLAHSIEVGGHTYNVDTNGRICGPGKFGGERRYVPYYWGFFLDGLADEDDGRTLSFDVTPEEKDRFPELRRRKRVRLIETDDGFVMEV